MYTNRAVTIPVLGKYTGTLIVISCLAMSALDTHPRESSSLQQSAVSHLMHNIGGTLHGGAVSHHHDRLGRAQPGTRTKTTQV